MILGWGPLTWSFGSLILLAESMTLSPLEITGIFISYYSLTIQFALFIIGTQQILDEQIDFFLKT